MSAGLEISALWDHTESGAAEERATTADLTIALDGELLTRIDDSWSGAVRPSVRVAAYPLALWLAGSWWRLRWEPSHGETLQWRAGTNWKMSHDLPAAGGGYVWPFVRFDSDGEGITVASIAKRRERSEPVEYLTEYASRVLAPDFESAVGAFIDRVVARLDQQGLPKTELHKV